MAINAPEYMQVTANMDLTFYLFKAENEIGYSPWLWMIHFDCLLYKEIVPHR